MNNQNHKNILAYQKDLSLKEKIVRFPEIFSFLSKIQYRNISKSIGFWIYSFIIPIIYVFFSSLIFILIQKLDTEGLIPSLPTSDYLFAGVIIPTIGISMSTLPFITSKFRRTNQLKRFSQMGVTRFDYMLTYLIVGFSVVIISQILVLWIGTSISIKILSAIFNTTSDFSFYKNINYGAFIPLMISFVFLFLTIGYFVSFKTKTTSSMISILIYLLIIYFLFGSLISLYMIDNPDSVRIIAQVLTTIIPFLIHGNILLMTSNIDFYLGDFATIYWIQYAIALISSVGIGTLIIFKNEKYFAYSLRK